MNVERWVIELCQNCDTEVEMVWDVKKYGYKAFCPHCGERLMLCDECQHGDVEDADNCDYNSETDSCRFDPEKTRYDIKKQLDMLHRDGYFDAEQIIRSLLRQVNISDMQKTSIKKLKLEYLKDFAREAYLDNDVSCDQLRSLWTAYCLHHNLTVDTATYDSDIAELWGAVSFDGEGTAEWNDFECFKNFMCAHLI